jgi:hypothetical protein
MTKFESLQDDGFISVSDTLRRWYDNLAGLPRDPWPESPLRTVSQPSGPDVRVDRGPFSSLSHSVIGNENPYFGEQIITTHGGGVIQLGNVSSSGDITIGERILRPGSQH